MLFDTNKIDLKTYIEISWSNEEIKCVVKAIIACKICFDFFFASRFYKVVGGAKRKSPHIEFIFKRRAIARRKEISNTHSHIHIGIFEYTLCWIGGNQMKIDRDRHKQHLLLHAINNNYFSLFASIFGVRPNHIIFTIFRLTPVLTNSRRLLNTRNQIRVFRIRIRKQPFITINWILC